MLSEVTRREVFYGLDFLRGGSIRRSVEEVMRCTSQAQSPGCKAAQLRDIAALLAHAAHTVPAYREFAGTALNDYPVVSKQKYLERYTEYCSILFDLKRLPRVHTSGSSGTPFYVPRDPVKRRRHVADVIAFGELAGFPLGSPLIFVKVPQHKVGQNRMKRLAENVQFFDVSRLDRSDIAHLHRKLNRYRSQTTIYGYASALEAVARAFDEYDMHPNEGSLRAVITTSEHPSAWLEKNALRIFGVSPVARYSNEENGMLAQQRKDSNDGYRLNTSSYFFEILEIDSDQAVSPGDMGRIVITDLYSRAFPMIRYDTGDLGRVDPKDEGLLLELAGRQRDMIYDERGHPKLPVTFTTLMRYYTGVHQFQFRQEGPSLYRLYLIADFDSARDTSIASQFRDELGETVDFDIRYVDSIDNLGSGKRRPVANLWKPL